MANSDKIGLGLDEIIRLDRSSDRRGRGGGRGGAGGNRGFRARGGRGGGNNGFRTRGGGGIPRTSNASAGGRWKHDLYGDNSNQNRGGQRSTGVNSTTKLLISNLDYNVTTNDIQELFEDIGAVRTARVHYDESGRSLGTAEVVFERRADATTAQKKYNGLNLDGRPMDIRLVGGTTDEGSVLQSNRLSSGNGAGGRNQRFGNRNNNNNQQNGNRGNGGRGGGRRQQNGNDGKKEVSAEDLDAELDAYRAESKQKKQDE